MKLEPLSDFVFLIFKKKKKTKTGVILSDASKDKPVTAEVIAVGPGRLDRHGNLIKTTLKKGDIVVIDPFSSREIKVDEKEYLILRESEIFSKI